MKHWIALLICLLLVLFTQSTEAARTVPMPRLVNPEVIEIDDNQLYIVEGTSIYIYDLNTLKFKKKFGRRGEGPREFIVNPESGRPMFIDVQRDNIIVTSLGKVSFFSKKGEFIKETRFSQGRGEYVQPLGDVFVGQSIFPQGDKLMRAIRLYDHSLKVIKDVVTLEHHFQRDKGISLVRDCQAFRTWNNKLFSAWSADFEITVFDADARKGHAIKFPYQRVKVTKQHKKDITYILETHPSLKNLLAALRPKLIFPEHFPAIVDLRFDEGKLYAIMFKETEKGNEIKILEPTGKLLKTIYVPWKKMDALQPYPFGIKNGKLYQVAEEGEDWVMQVTKL